MASEAYESAMLEIGALDKSKAQEAANVLEFIRENIQIWNQSAGGQKKTQAQHQKNLFSQQDSEAQFINQEDDDEDEDDGDDEYGEAAEY